MDMTAAVGPLILSLLVQAFKDHVGLNGRGLQMAVAALGAITGGALAFYDGGSNAGIAMNSLVGFLLPHGVHGLVLQGDSLFGKLRLGDTLKAAGNAIVTPIKK